MFHWVVINLSYDLVPNEGVALVAHLNTEWIFWLDPLIGYLFFDLDLWSIVSRKAAETSLADVQSKMGDVRAALEEMNTKVAKVR